MDNIKSYLNFLSGRHFNEALRATIGIVLPSFLLSYSGNLSIGIVMSAGALGVSITDVPGPVKYRVNGMLACIALIVLNVLLAGYFASNIWLMSALILFSGFVLSMLSVYGMRAASIGIAALLVLIISMDIRYNQMTVFQQALMFGVGGLWFMVYSMVLYRIRPYKVIQQVLGAYLLDIATYLRIRGEFYKPQPTYDSTYQQLLKQQIKVDEEHQLISELIFKTRATLKVSNHTARVLMKMYLDSTEVFESVMTTYHDYESMHKFPEMQPLLNAYHDIILLLSDEFVNIAIAIKSGMSSSPPNKNLSLKIKEARAAFDELRAQAPDAERINVLVSMGRILQNIDDLQAKTLAMHFQTTYDKKVQTAVQLNPDSEYQPVNRSIQPTIFFNNLNLKSGIFRHSMRVALALLTGYLIAKGFNLGHANWLLLTILVILKPAFSLTKKRNTDRLIGTVIGLVLGALAMLYINNHQVLLVMMILFMLLGFAFSKTNYFWSVIFTSIELVILFNLIFPGSIEDVLKFRALDTLIGSVIAGVFSWFVFPSWEHKNVQQVMEELIQSNLKYYQNVAKAFTDDRADDYAIKQSKRRALVALANLSETFNRMLSEPKQFQIGIEQIHRFLVINYSFNSHITTLMYLYKQLPHHSAFSSLHELIQNTNQHIEFAIDSLLKKEVQQPTFKHILYNKDQMDDLVERRQDELRQGVLESPLKHELITVKSVVDQFQHLQSLAITLANLNRSTYYKS